jgi:ABC-type bacteriocin/lantibiotic exporter with double-glycine peptidase domain
MADNFDILKGPSSYDNDELSTGVWLKSYAFTCLVCFSVIALFMGLLLIGGNMVFLPMMFLAVPVSAVLGFAFGSLIDTRKQVKTSWLRTEIDTSWFRNLRELEKEQMLDTFWDDWERNCKNTGNADVPVSVSDGYREIQNRRFLELDAV